MYDLTFDSCFIRTTLLRICFGLLFAVLAVAAPSEENAVAPELEILTMTDSNTNRNNKIDAVSTYSNSDNAGCCEARTTSFASGLMRLAPHPTELRQEPLSQEPLNQENFSQENLDSEQPGSEHHGYHHLPAIGVFPRSADGAPAISGYDNTPHVAATEKELWPTSARWQIAQGSDRLSFSPQLRFESKTQRLEIKPRRNSLRLLWRKSFR